MALQNAAHGRVACVNCHVGEGVRGFAYAKFSGVRQLLMMPMSSYPRPIPPGAAMQPGAQAMTCANCHQPGRAGGDRIRVIRAYADDEQNSETMTVLQMHVSASTSSQRAIHWHADPAIRVEYVSTDPERQTIPYVKVTDARGQVKEFLAADTTEQMISTGIARRWTASTVIIRSGTRSRRRPSRRSIEPSPRQWSAASSRSRGAKA